MAINLVVCAIKELKIYRNGNSAKFFLYAGNEKCFEELFTLTLNEIVVCGCYVSFASIVLHARPPDWLRRTQKK